MFIINHVAQSPGAASHSYQGMEGTLPESEFPDASQGGKQSQACYMVFMQFLKLVLFFTLNLLNWTSTFVSSD